MLVWKICFILLLSLRSVYQKKTRHDTRDRFTEKKRGQFSNGLGPGQPQASTTIGQTQSTVTVENRLSEIYKI